MTEPNQCAVEPAVPIWVSDQPSQAQPFDQQASFPTPPTFEVRQGDQPQGSSPPQPSFQYGFVPPVVQPVATKSAEIALVCGILSWVFFGAITAVPAVIFGVKGRREAREGRTPNGGMATAGLWLGAVNLVIFALFLGFCLILLAYLDSW